MRFLKDRERERQMVRDALRMHSAIEDMQQTAEGRKRLAIYRRTIWERPADVAQFRRRGSRAAAGTKA